VELKDKIQIGLDETRMLILVVQVLLGFDYRAVFEPGFNELPGALQYIKLGSLGAQLLVLGILLAIPSYHRIVDRGEITETFSVVIKWLMTWSLLPFALSLGAEFAVPGFKLFGTAGAFLLGITAGALAYCFWDLFPTLSRRKKTEPSMNSNETIPLTDKIKQVLTESRVVLPGTQALLGFQLITFLTQSFDQLPTGLKMAHLGALILTGVSAILLMTPPAYHRIAESGEASNQFHRLASGFLVAAMSFLALGLSVDFYVVASKLTRSPFFSVSLASTCLFILYGFWFAYPLAARRSRS
jgi:hypothetical protein